MQSKIQIIVISLLLIVAVNVNAQNVGIGTSTPNASAKLEVSDANRGFLPPRVALTSTSNITTPVSSPVAGLMLYNTATAGSGATAVTPGYYYCDGTQWVRMIAPTNSNTLASSTNTLTSTVNGIASSGATIINSNALTAASSALTSTVNGVASTLTPAAGTIGASTYLGFDASGNLVKGATPTTTNTLGLSGNTLTSTVNGVAATSSAVGTVSNTSSTNTLTTIVNGVAGTGVNIINSNSFNVSGNVLTSKINGITDTTIAVTSVSNTSSANTLTTTVNGVAGSGVNIINSNATSLSGTNLTTTVNGVGSTALDLSPLDSSIYKGDGTLRSNRTVTLGAKNLTFSSTTGNLIFNPSSTGRVGIGTSSPTTLFHVQGTGGDVQGKVVSTATTDRTILSAFNTGTNGGMLDMRAYGSSYSETRFGNSMAGAATLMSLSNAPLFIGSFTNYDLVFGTNDAERMRITSAGNIGIGTSSPGSALDVKGTLRLSGSTSGYVGLKGAAAAGSTTYTLPSADGTAGQALITNGSATLSWANPNGTLGTIGAGSNIPLTATGTYYCTGSYITLPPGKYLVQVYMILSPSSYSSSDFGTKTTPGNLFMKSFFADASQGTTAGTTMSPAAPSTNVTADVVGNGKLISGNISVAQQYSILSGFVIINNTSGANKNYYYWAGWVQTGGSITSSNTISSFGGTSFGEDNIVAYPVN